MKLIKVLTLLFAMPLSGFAQQKFSVLEIPVFDSPKDSITYATIQAEFQRLIANKSSFESTDSLMKSMMAMREKIVRYRKVYTGSPDFIPFDSLSTMKDLSEVKYLSLSGKKSIPVEVLACKKLEQLELVNTRIRKLSKQLKRLPTLTTVYVLNNKPSGRLRLGKNQGIKTLVIRGENPKLIPASFKRFTQLEKLDLASAELTNFPKGISKNKNLKELLLSNNHITLANDRITQHATLEKLELQRNKIKKLPASIQGLPNLKRLTLNYNSIETVDPALASLSKLEQLSFYHNKLTAVPAGLYALTSLREVDFYFNEIERIDDRISNLKNLEVLYLSNNRLVSLPEPIGTMLRLQELYISYNRLSELPASLANLTNLKVLRVNNNYLAQIPNDLSKLLSLENLDVSSNQISELPAGVYNLPYLKLLVLMNNPWDDSTRTILPSITSKLRSKEVVVHVNE